MKDEFGRFRFLNPMAGACYDPVTLTALGMSAGTAATVGAVSSVLGPVLQVAGALSEVSAGRRQAAEEEREGVETQVAKNIEADMLRKKQRQQRARNIAGQLESGVYSGTAVDLDLANTVQMERDALMIEYQGEQGRKSAQFRAAESRKAASPLKVFTAAVDGFSSFDPLNLAPGGGAIA